MALPTLSGIATVIAKEGVKGKTLPSGDILANFDVKFEKSRKDEASGKWETLAEIWVRVSAFGPLGEYALNTLNHMDRVHVDVEVEQGEYTTNSGETRHPVQGKLVAVGAALPKRDGGRSGSWGAAPAGAGSPSEGW